MSKADNPTTKFKVDITELKSGIQEANRLIKLANSEFKAASSGMDDWSKSTDGLSAKIKSLTTIQDLENKKLDNLKEQYTIVAAEQGENSKGAQELATKINNQQAAVNKVTAELNDYKDALADLQDNSAENRTALEKLNDQIKTQEKHLESAKRVYANAVLQYGETSDRAQALAGAIDSLSLNLNENKSKLKAATDAADDLDKSMADAGDGAEDAGEGFTIAKGVLAELAADAIRGAIDAVKDLAGQLLELPEATREFRSVFGATMESARDSAIGVDGATKAYEEFYAVAADEGQAAEATSHLSGLVSSQNELQGALDGVIGAWVEYGDSISIEGLSEAANETAKTGVITGQFADALNWAGQSEEDFQKKLDECTTTQERQKLVVDTLNELYGEQAENYKENNKSVLDANAANLQMLETQSELSTVIEPLTAAWTNLKANALDALIPTLTFLAEKITSITTFFKEHEKVAAMVQFILTAVAIAFGVLAGAMAIQSLITGIQKAFALLNTTMLANPIVLIVAAVAGLVAAFVLLWNKSEAFREFWIGLWDAIKSAAKVAWDAISGFFKTAWNVIKTIWGGVIAYFTGIWNGIKAVFSAVKGFFSGIFSGAYNAITNVFSGLYGFFSGVWSRITGLFKSVGTTVGNAIGGSVKGAINSVLSGAVGIINGFISAINGAISVINAIPGVKVSKLSKLSVPRLAEGGVVSGATLAVIGEDGKEAVVPLENNLGWIKGLASNIAGELKGNSFISGADTINNNYVFNQTNNSPKALSRIDLYRQTKQQMKMLKGVGYV